MLKNGFACELKCRRKDNGLASLLIARVVGILVLSLFTNAVVRGQSLIIQGVYHANGGDQLLNPNNQANFASTITPLINPCQGNTTDYRGVNCSWPINSKQWPDPQFTFSVEAPYNTTAYNVSWKLVAAYTDRGKFPNSVSLSTTLTGNQSWSPQGSAHAYGGSVAVQAEAKPVNNCNNGVTGKLTFSIWGVNQDAAAQLNNAASQYNGSILGGAAWFLPNLIAQESGGLQFGYYSNASHSFVSNQYPMWGAPDGIGVMQVDRVPHPTYFANNEDPYWNFIVNLQDGLSILSSAQQNSTGVCSTNSGEVTYCKSYAYDWWDRQVWQACSDSGGSSTPTRSGGPGTETCNVQLVQYPQYPGGAPSLPYCNSALSWNTQNPNGHFQDFDWIQLYNGAPCGYFLYWDRTSRSWVFNTGSCTKSGITYPNYVVNVCQRAPAY